MIRSILLIALTLTAGCAERVAPHEPPTAEQHLQSADPQDRVIGVMMLLEREPIPWSEVGRVVLRDPSEYVRCTGHGEVSRTKSREALRILAAARHDPGPAYTDPASNQ